MAGTLDGDIQVPAVGKVSRKTAAGGLAVVALLIGIYYYRKRQNASAASTAASAATSTNQYPPDGTVGNPDDPYSTDPATGQTYGNEAAGSGGTYGAYDTGDDEGDLETSDSYPWDGSVGNEDDPYSLDPASGITYGDEGLATGGTSANPSGGPPFANNSDWETWAIQQLSTSDPSIDTDGLTTALGLYLNGQPVTAAQKTLIFDATGIAGDPPVAGPNNYPPNVQTNGSTGGSGSVSTTTSTAKVKVPNVVGQRGEDAKKTLEAAKFKVIQTPATTPEGKSTKVTSQNPDAGTEAPSGSTVAIALSVSK
jgi:hypothetical protein